MHYYETVTEAVKDLGERGYKLNFNIARTYLSCTDQELHLRPEEFQIDETYRFEGETDPGDEMVVYAVSSEARRVKGVLVNAYGPYADELSAELIAKLTPGHQA